MPTTAARAKTIKQPSKKKSATGPTALPTAAQPLLQARSQLAGFEMSPVASMRATQDSIRALMLIRAYRVRGHLIDLATEIVDAFEHHVNHVPLDRKLAFPRQIQRFSEKCLVTRQRRHSHSIITTALKALPLLGVI